MPIDLQLVLTPQQASDQQYYLPILARRLGVKPDQIALVRITRRSVDARNRQVKLNMGFQVYVDADVLPPEIHFDYPDVRHKTPVVVVGSGPAGIFAALRLIELGLRPIVLERGKDVSARKRDIAHIHRNGEVNPDSNYAFGEGGAGTYSDGKLFTRSKKRGDFRKALEVFRFHGADESILYDAHPHIGTDRLPGIIAAMREQILRAGGNFRFDAKVTGYRIGDGRIEGVYIGNELIEGAAVVLATGHSARDVYEDLHAQNILLEAKAFAMGVRVEHPQELIDSVQYHTAERNPYLPAASYSLVTQVNGRGVYSFCMCPGGFMVPAMTHRGESVVNGMSPSGRNSVYANSGIVTEVRPEDFAFLQEEYGVLAGMRYQQQIEELAWQQVGDRQVAPAQRLTDFVKGDDSAMLPKCSYVPGVVPTRMDRWMPEYMSHALRQGFRDFDRKMKGFLTHKALIAGMESRTSSPVRIPRDPDTCMHLHIEGLFPCGEGAGYAGGIISAAMDGERCADAASRFINGK